MAQFDAYQEELYWFTKDISESDPDLARRKLWLHSRWYEDEHYFTWLDAARLVNARMTFCFLWRDVPYRKRVIRRMVDEGHEVGTHGRLHYLVTPEMTRTTLRDELEMCVDGLAEVGVEPNGLWIGAKGAMSPEAAAALVDVGIEWFSSVTPHDNDAMPDGVTWVPAKYPHDVELLFYHPRPAAEVLKIFEQQYDADPGGAFMMHLFTYTLLAPENMEAWKDFMRYTGGCIPVSEKLATGSNAPAIVSDASLHLAQGKAVRLPD